MAEIEPVILQEDERTGDRFLVYSTENGPRLDIRYEGDTLWMTQAQIAELFGRDISTISRHIANIVEEGELDESNLHKVQIALVEAGNPLQSRYGDLGRLPRFLHTGYAVSSLGDGQAGSVRDQGFRRGRGAAEAPRRRRSAGRTAGNHPRYPVGRGQSLSRAAPDCALCQDYDGESESWRDFFQTTQAKIVYAVTFHTPAEIVKTRADASRSDMGLVSWPNANIRKGDVVVSKNYFGDAEVRELNRLTTILLDIFEDQANWGVSS